MGDLTHAERHARQMDKANASVMPSDHPIHARVWAAEHTSHEPERVGNLAAKLLDTVDGLDDATKAAQAVVKKL